MTFRALLYAYVLGGLTFLPLVLAAVVAIGWRLLPKVDEAAEAKRGDVAEKRSARREDDKKAIDDLLAKKHEEISDGGASGTFAVLRKYDFQAANAALIARNNASANVAGGSTAGDSGAEAGKESESVYQSMYRSVFDRGKGPSQSTSVLASEEGETETTPYARTRRNVTPANVFYIVLRHGHLMLYDSPSQLEVRHVISLAHHNISLAEGESSPGTEEHQRMEKEIMNDGELFIKRTAIVLTPMDLPNGHLQSRTAPSQPFYLFAATCSEKEDFYHSLLYTRSRPPIPEPLEPNDVIKLQSTLHSTSLTPETRALNTLFGRIFLGLYHTDRAKQFIQTKVEKKISRVQKPAFIASLAVKSIDLGDSAPVLSNMRLKDLHISGDMTVACDIKYTGGIKLTIAAVAKLDLGTRFKTRFVDLVLATSLQRLQGHMLVSIKPPPSNRLWFCFESAPDMDIKVEPVVSQRQITYTWILKQIEDRIRAVVAETLVKPNWDDATWFDTRGQSVRGGIWRDEGGERTEEKAEKIPTGADMLKARNSKTKSMPVLPGMSGGADSSGASSGSETGPRFASGHAAHASDAEVTLKRRSLASLPVQSATPPRDISSPRSLAKPPPLPLRTPSYSSSTPSVALDESPASIDPIQNADALPQAQRKWRFRNTAQQLPTRKEAVEAMREMRDKASARMETGLTAEKEDGSSHERPSTADGEDSSGYEQRDSSSGTPAMAESPPSTQTGFADRSLRSIKRTDTNLSTTSTASTISQNQQRKQNILAATAAATNAARNWSWNAYQTAKKNSPARTGNTASQQQSDAPPQPLGRGQPLPPPGVPLPGPNRGLFGSFGGSVKRKPVLPPRKPTLDDNSSSSQYTTPGPIEKATTHIAEEEVSADTTQASDSWANGDTTQSPVSDEFGPWRENSGAGLDAQTEASHDVEAQFDDGIRVTGGDGQVDDHQTTTPMPSQHHAQPQADDGIRVTGNDEHVEDEQTTTLVPPPQKKAPPPLPPRRPTKEVSRIEATDAVHPNDAPAAQNAEQAEAKFALGVDVGEEDFEHTPVDDGVLDTKTHEAELESLDEDSKGEEIVGIPAPIDEDLKELQQPGPRPEPANSSKSGDLQSRFDMDGSTSSPVTGP